MHDDLQRILGERLVVRPLGLDDFSSLRHLHLRSLAGTAGVLSEEEIEAFRALVGSPAYSDLLLKERTYGAWFDGELVGTVSWQGTSGANATARIGSVFVRHPGLGIGRRLLGEAEARAFQAGFFRFAAWATANAVSFFEHLGYRQVSRGIKSLSADCQLPVTFLRKELPPPLPRPTRLM
jgi:GNAT superfamily N-acetyltransferase